VLAWRLASVKEWNPNNASKVQAAKEDGYAEGDLRDRKERSECPSGVCGTNTEQSEDCSESTGKKECVERCRFAFGQCCESTEIGRDDW
jgi:hypothetical protein